MGLETQLKVKNALVLFPWARGPFLGPSSGGSYTTCNCSLTGSTALLWPLENLHTCTHSNTETLVKLKQIYIFKRNIYLISQRKILDNWTFLNFCFYFIHMSIFALVYGCISHTWSALRGQSWASDTLSLELDLSHHVGAGNQTMVLYRGSQVILTAGPSL